jgi:hypothetical protein
MIPFLPLVFFLINVVGTTLGKQIEHFNCCTLSTLRASPMFIAKKTHGYELWLNDPKS